MDYTGEQLRVHSRSTSQVYLTRGLKTLMTDPPTGYDIRLGSKNDGEKIVSLLDQGFNGWPKLRHKTPPLEYWRWKHVDNPRGESLIIICEIKGDIIGVTHNGMLQIKQGDALITGAQASDGVVHKDYRQMGISTAISPRGGDKFNYFKDRGVCYNLAVTRHPHLLRSLERKQYPRFPHKIHCYTRIRDIQKHLENIPMDKEWLIKTGYKALSFINAITQQLKQPSPKTAQRTREIDLFEEDIDTFWDQVSRQYDFIGVRDENYLNWRYCDPRAGDYKVTVTEDEGGITGYIVTGVNETSTGYQIGYIMDILTHPAQPNVASQLIAEAVKQMDEDGVNITLCLAIEGNPIEVHLSQNGFLNSFQNYELFILPTPGFTKHEKIPHYRPERVHYTWGDHDSLPTTIKSQV